MNPTHTMPEVDPTPADILRCAALYLTRHGWHQGDMYTDPGQLAPAACALGAIHMVVCGHTGTDYTDDQLDIYDRAVAILADHIDALIWEIDTITSPWISDGYDEPFSPTAIVAGWNDDARRTVHDVRAALADTAAEWDRLHPTGGSS